jgi:hypothetical protein
MTESVLDAKIRRHNAAAGAKAGGYFVGASAAWFVSWWVIWGIAFLFVGAWWHFPSGITRTCAWVAWGGCALLAAEGVRYGKKLFDLESYSRSLAFATASGDPRTALLLTGTRNPLGVAYVISQGLFIAPRLTVGVVRALRSRVSLDAETRAEAEAARALIASRRGWTSAPELSAVAAGVYPLQKLGLVEARVDDSGAVRFRIEIESTVV